MRDDAKIKGKFIWEIRNPDGTLADSGVFRNAATTVGLNYLLDTGFRSGTQVTAWYASLINNAAFSALSSADTMSSHPGWAEWTGYNESTRVAWSPPAAAGGVLANTTVMTFTNNSGSTVTIRGMFLTSGSVKGGTTGTLWATAVEDSGRALASSQTFQVIYETSIVPQS